jgi:histidyl-tRNA synthetase
MFPKFMGIYFAAPGVSLADGTVANMKSNISGFPEFLPNEQIAFSKVVEMIREKFESHGFVPMDTPAVERVDTLLAKGNDHEIYGLYRLADGVAKKDLGLRFDLTVPLARYVSSYSGQLIFPYKRYHIAPVWRGERPQHGRYRQFYQCDVDVIGDGVLSVAHDAEILLLMTEALRSINTPAFHTKINNRKILSGFFKTVLDEKMLPEATRLTDKIDKISQNEFDDSLLLLGVSPENLCKIKEFLGGKDNLDNAELLKWLKTLNFNEEFCTGVAELEEILGILVKFEELTDSLRISLRLARGLTYYTGNIFETVMNDFPDAGSIAGGGRYNNLVGMLSDKKFPGVGATIGISRLVPKLLENGLLSADKLSTARILVTVQQRDRIGDYVKIAARLRRIGLKTEIYLQDKNLGTQLSYASKKGIKFALIANLDELLENRAIIRNLETGDQSSISISTMDDEVLKIVD